MPDWLSGTWRKDMPQLAGKVKLMPLPAWEKGGRRTSVWGGTMLAISKNTKDFEKTWAFAKYLYTSPKVAEELYKQVGIVSPVKKMWDPKVYTFYDEPVPYFCGQPAGRLFLNLAPQVPLRTSSPFHADARSELQNVVLDLQTYAEARHATKVEELEGKAKELLDGANRKLQNMIDEDLFVDPRKEMVKPEGTP
jgi:arabinosaccharide transport system substrate-binding protein